MDAVDAVKELLDWLKQNRWEHMSKIGINEVSGYLRDYYINFNIDGENRIVFKISPAPHTRHLIELDCSLEEIVERYRSLMNK